MDRSNYPVRVLAKGEKYDDTYIANLSPAERLNMMWPLAVEAWAFKGENVQESRLQRHVVRIHRREG